MSTLELALLSYSVVAFFIISVVTLSGILPSATDPWVKWSRILSSVACGGIGIGLLVFLFKGWPLVLLVSLAGQATSLLAVYVAIWRNRCNTKPD